MKFVFQILVTLLAAINLLLAWPALYRLRQPTTLALWGIKVFISAITPLLFLTGVLTAIAGLALNWTPAIALGSAGALLFLIHIIAVTRAPDSSTDFDQAFGPDWEKRLPEESKAGFLPRRYVFRLPATPDPVFEQNIVFYTIPHTNRQVLCDIWQPPKQVKRSGLAFIYLHGSAWAVLDKDFGTRPFFRHLANQGHVIMDIAYRLFPETDFMGMTQDTKHAIAWMKANAAAYGVNPDRIVIGGGSAGAHIALLAAYTDQNRQMMPEDLASADISVRGVIALYGQSDLEATYYHTCQHLVTRSALSQKKKGESGGMPSWAQKSLGKDFHRLGFDKDAEPGILAPILGGTPAEKADVYALFSPVTHVHPGCPPTLILHGKHDILAPVKAIRQLHGRLTQAGVPVVMHLIPLTDHAFDMILPKISPSAHNAYYDAERFLALLA
ncbi:MAG: alpha/beta hydrolase [Thermoanaerobaculia bacterium]|nr:alpha/beta hydrolase [Thermoanaerobaculia bacterium]